MITYTNTNSPNKTEWTAKYTTSESDNNGDVSYTIQYQDLATNSGTNVTGGGTIRFDKTAPTLSSVSISSDNTPAALAKAGSEVTLSFTSSETIQTPSGNDVVFKSGGTALYNNSRVITYAGSGTNWTAKYTTHANDTDGNVTFTINFDDLAGNNDGANVTAVTSGGNVTFDDTNPTITGTTINSANSLVTVTFAENVYKATGGAGDLEVGDFALSISGGVATIGSATPTSISKTSQTVWVLGFSTSGIANGSETISVVPVSNSIYDQAGNAAATSQSNNTAALNEKVLPIISGTTVNSANSLLTVTFAENVYNATGGSGTLEVGDFALSISGGAATIGRGYANVNFEDLPVRLGSGIQYVGHSQWL